MVLAQYDYLLAIGTIFTFLDAWNIGANDVANSFATSVGSRSLKLWQAMIIATCMEFAGSMSVGARVADTIRNKVIATKLFAEDPAVLMLAMVCAIVSSSLYLTLATRIGLPVSTTHSIMGGVIGVGIAAFGTEGISWGWSGVSQVFAAWAIAPGIAGSFGAIIFLVTKYGVMLRKNPVKKAFFSVPIYFGITSALLALLICWKGGSTKIKLGGNETIGVIFGTGGAIALLITIFFLPYIWRKVVHDDWELKWYYIPLGPLLLRRGEVPPHPEHHHIITDYYAGHKTREELETEASQSPEDIEKHPGVQSGEENTTNLSPHNTPPVLLAKEEPKTEGTAGIVGPKPEGPIYSPVVLFWWVKFAFFHGVDKDVVGMQKKRDVLSGDLDDMHARAAHYDNKAEYMYSFLQVMTAATASFTHGANDVSNAIGPYTTVYLIWHSGKLNNKEPVPLWILAFGGVALVIGLWTYGYNIMRNLGNRLTLHSPSRGFSMELGSAITVVMATRLKLPVSTTQCIVGATVGVGLCNGDWRTINWRMVAWIYMGWFITLPVTGIMSGCLMGIIINAPRFGYSA